MLSALKKIKTIFFKELLTYFTTPPAYVFLIIFLLLTSFFTFAASPFGDLLNTNDTALSNSFFIYHPWLFLILVPSIGMRLWSEERKNGTIELLFTMPIKTLYAVLGKYFAALLVVSIAIILTCPIVFTVNWLGEPDNYAIAAGYLSSFLLAASYLSLSSMFSAITKNQIISFIVSFIACLIIALIGHPAITDLFTGWAPVWFTSLLANLSIFPHFEIIQKGIIDFKDILYFISLILFGLIGTTIFLRSRSLVSVIKILLILIVIININFILGNYFSLRKDITKDKLYTLSEGTVNVLKKLDSTVTIRYYKSYKKNRLPIQLRSYATRITDLLQEYGTVSGGKVKVELFDPVPDSDEETSAIIDGVQGQLLKNGEKCYFGMTISCMGENQTIGFLSPENEKTIEYDLTRAIYDVTHHKKSKIGIISSLPIMGDYLGGLTMQSSRSLPWIFVQELQRLFDVNLLEYDIKKIGKDVDLLIIYHPKNLSESTQLAIDQYLLGGGKLLIFVDPYCISDTIISMKTSFLGNERPPGASSLPKLFNAWGVSFTDKDNVVIAPKNTFQALETPLNNEHPGVIKLKGNSFINPDNIVTTGLNTINLVFSGAFKVNSKKGIKSEVIFKTDSYSEVMGNFNYKEPVPQLMNKFVSEDVPSNLGIILKGKFETAFPEKMNKDSSQLLLRSKYSSSIILVGDVDMLFNSFCVAKQQIYGRTVLSTINSNLDFLMNAVDQLSGSQDIIEIRTRGRKEREFERFVRIYTNAKQKYNKEILQLEKQLQKTSEYINELQSKQKDKTKLTLSSKQMNTLRKYKLEEKDLNIKLRDIRKLIREKIDNIKLRLEIINLIACPLLVFLIGLLISIFKFKHCNKIT